MTGSKFSDMIGAKSELYDWFNNNINTINEDMWKVKQIQMNFLNKRRFLIIVGVSILSVAAISITVIALGNRTHAVNKAGAKSATTEPLASEVPSKASATCYC